VEIMMNRRDFTRLAAAGSGAALFIPRLGALYAAELGPVVETTAGRIRGAIDDGVHVFKGIPYGAPTAGQSRFKPPARRAPWSGVRETMEYGPHAPQGNGAGPGTMSEDCLVLNLWTRGLGDGVRRPVMVWLHGGGFSTGSGSSTMYDGANLARLGDVVVVTLNHRLNVFGYLHLEDVAGPIFAGSGNAGMLDIVLALRWVHENIAAFGGDSSNITIFGESGGGRKVSTLMAMPAAAGLFHRAIIQSGPGLHLQPRDRAAELTRSLLAELAIEPSRASELQKVPVATLLSAYAAVERRLDNNSRDKGVIEQHGFVPTAGVDTLPGYPFDPVATPLSADVPLLIGTNMHEHAYLLRNDPKIHQRTLTEEELRARVITMTGRAADRVLEMYRARYPTMHPAVRYILMLTDRTYRCDSIVLAQRKAALKRASVFMYLFAWETPVDQGRLMAHHALEIAFVFANTDKAPAMSGGGPKAAALARKMSDAWVAFARTGNPNTASLPEWPAYDATTRATMMFDDVCAVENDPGEAERRLWQTI
jgi:para-nitrobenzyl esterase